MSQPESPNVPPEKSYERNPAFELGDRLELHMKVGKNPVWLPGKVVKLNFHSARFAFDDPHYGTTSFSYDNEWRKPTKEA